MSIHVLIKPRLNTPCMLEGNALGARIAVWGFRKDTLDIGFVDMRREDRAGSDSSLILENPQGYDSDASISLHAQ
jgi:hypothetical protein